jgi:hypothetical protein
MDTFHTVVEFLQLVALTTFSQLVSLLGIFFVAGLILYLLARFTRNSFSKISSGKLDVILTGWLGTPVHELGHAFFCVVFAHRITAIKLYRPNAGDGSLGYVQHSYNSNSTYQKIGNLFIGAGPVILGAIVLYAVMYLLLPNQKPVAQLIASGGLRINNIMDITTHWDTIYAAAVAMLEHIFHPDNFSEVKFWVFVYLSICIASHMELSPADLKGMMRGLLPLIVLLLVINLIALLAGHDISHYIFYAGSYVGMFFGVYVYAIMVSLLNFLVSYLLLSVYSLLRYRKLYNPVF